MKVTRNTDPSNKGSFWIGVRVQETPNAKLLTFYLVWFSQPLLRREQSELARPRHQVLALGDDAAYAIIVALREGLPAKVLILKLPARRIV